MEEGDGGREQRQTFTALNNQDGERRGLSLLLLSYCFFHHDIYYYLISKKLDPFIPFGRLGPVLFET